jgi:hypothetical protein
MQRRRQTGDTIGLDVSARRRPRASTPYGSRVRDLGADLGVEDTTFIRAMPWGLPCHHHYQSGPEQTRNERSCRVMAKSQGPVR